MRILFITDNFPPESNAPALRTYEHCLEWSKKGASITVLTCVPNFPKGKVFMGYKNSLYQVEVVDGMKVIRVWSYIAPNAGFVKRTADFISFGIMAFLAGLRIKTDIIIATSPQIFTAVSGSFLSFFKRKPWIMEVRDLWPESIVAVGMMETNSLMYRVLENIERRLYKSANRIVVVTNSFKTNLIERGVAKDKIDVIMNGVDLTRFNPGLKNDSILEKLGLQGKFIIGYIGTHGMAHGLEFILRCAAKVNDSRIHFLFIGDGAEKGNLVKLSQEMALTNVTLLPAVLKNEVYDYLSVIDVALVNLKRSDTFKTVIPSKVFENAAMEKPILLGVNGEIREIVERFQAGIYFEPENEADFMNALQNIQIPESYQRFAKGAEQLAKNYDRKLLANEMLDIVRRHLDPVGHKQELHY